MLIVGPPLEAPEHRRVGHPERPGRVEAAMAGVADLGLGGDALTIEGRLATRTELTLVHTASYLDELESFCAAGGGDLDPDTFATATSFDDARAAAGAGLAVVDELSRRGHGVGFVAVRPPGHHALADRAMGFCLLNNVAVAAATLAARGEHVLVVDWDVHHGNGTQDLFWCNPHVLYVSTHQWPLYPGTGRAREIGGPGAFGYTVNIPLPPGSTGDSVRRAIDEVALPAIEVFGPSWVLVSAGFDAHRADPMADLAVETADFGALAATVAGFAPTDGRVVLFLEGGYELGAIRESVAASLTGAMGETVRPFGRADEAGRSAVAQAKGERTAALRQARERAPSERILE